MNKLEDQMIEKTQNEIEQSESRLKKAGMSRKKKIIMGSIISSAVVLLSLGGFALYHTVLAPSQVEAETELVEKPKAEATPEVKPEATPDPEVESKPEVSPEAKPETPAGMNFTEILDWNFSSIVGNWVTSDGSPMILTDTTLSYDGQQFLIQNVSRNAANSLIISTSPIGGSQRYLSILLFPAGTTIPQFGEYGQITSIDPTLDRSNTGRDRMILNINQYVQENNDYKNEFSQVLAYPNQ